jgi:Tfp pilus assembly protein PilN
VKKSSFVFAAFMLVFVVGGGLVLFSQRQDTIRLQGERDRVRMQQEDVVRLQSENRRLKERQPTAAELQALRADHVALLRLRAELDALKQK